MNDEFLDLIRRDWRRHEFRPEEIARDFVRYRRWARWSQIGAGAGAASIFVAFVWLAWMALDKHSVLITVSALAFAAALPVVLFGLLKLRGQARQQYEKSTLGLLTQRRDRAETMRQMLSGSRWCALILLGAVGGVCVVAAAGYASLSTLLTLSGLWGGTAAIVWLWQIWRARQLADESLQLDVLIAEFEGANQAVDGP